jgi:hypothetical protein
MGQDDNWQPTLLTEQAPVPANVAVSEGIITWEDSPYALLYAVCKDGKVVAFTTESTYTPTENGSYSVRAANEMGGLSAASVAVEIAEATAIENVDANDNLNVNVPVKVIKNGRLYIGDFNISGQRVK